MAGRRRGRNDPPEQIIERAQKLVETGKLDDAMNELYSLIQYRRRAQWVEAYETAMKEYVKIGVENLKSCREGLVSYRNMVQQARPDSLEKVLMLYIELCEEKGNREREIFSKEESEAKDESTLDEIRTRQFESKTLKYQWDCYSNVLLVLKNNGRLNHVYCDTVTRASQFCRDLGRSNELKSLCDVIRRRLPYIENNQDPEYALKLNSVTLNAMVANRLQLLDTALAMNLYQESYKSMTDTLQVIKRDEGLKKSIDYHRLSQFYEQISRVFWSCELYLLHAYAVYRSYHFRERHVQSLGKKQKNKSEELLGLRQLLARAMVAALVVTSENNGLVGDDQSMYTLAEQYNLTEKPDRSSLIATLRKESQLFEQSSTAALNLCQLLENPFNPLSFTAKFKAIVTDLEKEGVNVEFYRNGLRKVGVIRMLSQLSRVYKSIGWQRFRKLSFDDMSDEALERIITEAMRNGSVSVRLSHSSSMITFADDSMESPTIQNHLYCLAQRLGAISLEEVDSKRMEEDKRRQDIFKVIKRNVETEHKQVSLRLQMIAAQRRNLEDWKKAETHKVESRKRMEQDKEKEQQRQRYAAEKKRREEDEKKKQAIEEKKSQVQSWAKKLDLRPRTNIAPAAAVSGFAAAVAAGKSTAVPLVGASSTVIRPAAPVMIRPPVQSSKEKELVELVRRAQLGDTSLTVELLEEKHEEIQADRRRREREAQKEEKRLFDFQIRSERKYLIPRIMKTIATEKGQRIEDKKQLYRNELKNGKAKHAAQLEARDRVRFIKEFVSQWESQLNEEVQRRNEEQKALKAKKEEERKEQEAKKLAKKAQQQSQPVRLKAGVGGGGAQQQTQQRPQQSQKSQPQQTTQPQQQKAPENKPPPRLKAGVGGPPLREPQPKPQQSATDGGDNRASARPGKYQPSRRRVAYNPPAVGSGSGSGDMNPRQQLRFGRDRGSDPPQEQQRPLVRRSLRPGAAPPSGGMDAPASSSGSSGKSKFSRPSRSKFFNSAKMAANANANSNDNNSGGSSANQPTSLRPAKR